MVIAYHDFLCHIHFASFNSADTDTTDVIVVVDCGYEKLQFPVFVAFGSGDIIDNRIEERFEVFAGDVVVASCRRLFTAAIQNGALKLLVACVEVEQKFQHFVADFCKSCVGLVDFVDYYYDFESQSQCFFNDETRLRHRSFLCVNQKYDAVDHFENALHFTRKIRVSGSVDDIDFYAVIMYGRILCQNGDTSFSFEVTRVHNARCYLLIFSKRARLFEHTVHERSFAVVDVCDDCNVSQIVSDHNRTFFR